MISIGIDEDEDCNKYVVLGIGMTIRIEFIGRMNINSIALNTSEMECLSLNNRMFGLGSTA